MKRAIFAIIIIVMITAVSAKADISGSTECRRIAVLPLQKGTGIIRWWEGELEPEAALTDALYSELNKIGFQVLKRQDLDKTIKDKDLGRSGSISAETAAQIGRQAGIRYLVTGIVTEFNQTGNKNSTAVNNEAEDKTTRTSADIRVIDVNTGLYSENISASDEITISGHEFDADCPACYDNDFKNSAVGKSMIRVAENLANQIDAAGIVKPEAQRQLEGSVIQVSGGRIQINIGSNAGVAENMVFSISRPIVIIDPQTKEKRAINNPICDIKIISVAPDSAIGVARGDSKGILPKDRAVKK